MYYQVIAQCTQSLKNLEICLDKAERYAATKKFDVGVLMSGRLAPDMQPFTYQVQSACDSRCDPGHIAGIKLAGLTLGASFAIFAAIRRAPSRINTVGPVLARFFGVSPVTAADVKTVYLSRREWWTHHRGGCRG